MLVNDVWGGDPFISWGKTIWEHSLDGTLTDRAQRHRDAPDHQPPGASRCWSSAAKGLVVEVTDGKGDAPYRTNVPYDLVKTAVVRLGEALAVGARARTVSPR